MVHRADSASLALPWRPRVRVRTLDKYLLRTTAVPFAAILLTVVLLLGLESLPGLLPLTSKIGHGVALLLRMLASLVPEYLGIAIPVGLFLATGVALRRLSLNSELDAITAAGISDLRMAASLIVLGMVACALQFAVRSYWQPWGERRFDQLVQGIGTGDFGLNLLPGIFNKPTKGTTIYFDRAGSRPGGFEGVMIETPRNTIVASWGTAGLDKDMELNLILRNGTVLPSGSLSDVGAFSRISLSVPFEIPRPRSKPLRDRLDRLDLPDLLLAESRTSAGVQRAAGAAASARLSSALLCLVLPLLAVGLAMPPKRSTSSLGLGIGLILIVAYLRLSAMIEDTFAAHAWFAHGALLFTMAALCAALIRLQTRNGRGSPVAHLSRLAAPLYGLLDSMWKARTISEREAGPDGLQTMLPSVSSNVGRREAPNRSSAPPKLAYESPGQSGFLPSALFSSSFPVAASTPTSNVLPPLRMSKE